MRASQLLLLLLLGVVSISRTTSASEDPKEALPGVHDLDVKTFDEFVNGKKHALVEFYAPWCGHCKRLTPELKKLGEAVLSDPKLKNRVVIAKVNADDHRALGERFGIKGFPTLKWFPRGEPVDSPESYEGGRSVDAFLKFIEMKLENDGGYARVKQLDPLALAFLEAEDKAAASADMKELANSLSGDDKSNGQLYVKAVEKALSKGDEYFAKEYGRLSRMLASGNVNQEKVDELSRKASVLSAFLPEE